LNDLVWTTKSVVVTSASYFLLGNTTAWAAKEEKQSVPAAVANQVETYKDLVKGYKILRPIGWNQFAGQRNQYDIKWQDIIQPLEVVMIATVDVGKSKSVKDLGSPTVRVFVFAVDCLGCVVTKISNLVRNWPIKGRCN
jgi:hypothetical protein